MTNPLLKRIPRDLIKNFPKYFGMIIILVCTISIGSSFQITLNGATAYLNKIKDKNCQEDGYFEISTELDEGAIEYFEEEGVQVYSNYYVTENEYGDSGKIIIFAERDEIDIPTVFDGQLPEASEIAIDHVFARQNNIGIGDTITLLGQEYTVSGTVSLPDYTALFMNNTDLVMNTKHFGVAVVDDSTFKKIDKKSITYRYSYRFNDRKLGESEKADKAENMQKHLYINGYSIQSFLRNDQNQSISFLENDIGADGPFMTVFVYMLVALIAFVFAILTSHTIESESVIIGTLRVSGYRKSEIIGHYLTPAIIVAAVGSVIGNLLGYFVMIKPFLDIYYTSYSIGPIEVEFDFGNFVFTTILPVLIMLAINFIMLWRKLSLQPLKFLRKDLKKGKQRKTIKLPNISFLNRFRLRVIIQNRGSYVMMFIGIFLSSFLLMFGIGLKPLMKHYTESIDKSLPYEYQYILKAPVDTNKGEKICIEEFQTWFDLGKKDMDVMCYGINSESTFFADAYTKEGISISSALSHKLNLDEGDTLHIEDKNNDQEYDLKISKVFAYDASLAMFIDQGKLNELLDNEKETYNCIISNEELDIDDQFIAKKITRNDMLGAADQMIASFSTVILFINIFSVIVYLVIMYIMTKLVIDKNALSISYMKVFGYEDREIRKLYLTATSFVVIVSLIVCIPLEIALFKGTLVFLSSMIEGYVEFYLPTYVYFEIIVIGIVAYLCINALHMYDVKKIPMTEALKNRE